MHRIVDEILYQFDHLFSKIVQNYDTRVRPESKIYKEKREFT